VNEGRRRAWVHLGTEFLVVFLSVVLALVANDWRQSRIDRRSERQALALMLRELRQDSLDLTFYRRRLLGQDSAAAWLVTHVDRRDVPADSVRRAAIHATSYFNYRPTFPTYDGLRTSGRLTLIREVGLHDAVVSFFGGTVPYLDDLRQKVKSRSLETARAQLAHFMPRPAPGSGVFSISGDNTPGWAEWKQTTSLAAIRADHQYLGDVAALGVSAAWLVRRIDQVFLPRSGKLQALIRQDLGVGAGS
jgi:hypothetical protein